MNQSPPCIVIVGAGIVGSALAYYLSNSSKISERIILVDRSFKPLKGSTGHAPGFVGQFNESDILARLAIDSVGEYLQIPGGFDVVGGLEIAVSEQGVEKLKARCESARELGLSAELISSKQAVDLAHEILNPQGVKAALHFPHDGAAAAGTITSFYQNEARKLGVELVEDEVIDIQINDGQVVAISTNTGTLETSTVVMATGIWTAGLCKLDLPIPIIPVAHPYMYGPPKQQASRKMPWVRWPEHHVYARDHGPYFGIGSYDHRPIHLEPRDTAIGDWIPEFDQTLSHAQNFWVKQENLDNCIKLNGIFAMTPDSLPLVGPIPSTNGLFMIASVWVTQAAGSAKLLTRMMERETIDENFQKALDPARFQGHDWDGLKETSLARYNDIYTTGKA